MTVNVNNVLIVGAGQLGSRYLQGLSKCKNHLNIFVQDISTESLTEAELRWQEVNGPSTHHKVSFNTEIKQHPQNLDLAIIATTANSRPNVVRTVTQHSMVRYWLLEKILAQNTQGLKNIQQLIGNNSLAWVNTPRRITTWYKIIKNRLLIKDPIHVTVTGGAWGLACNTIHFLDLITWLSEETLLDVCTDHLNKNWFNAKRTGNWEISGELTATFTGGTTAKLISSSDGEPSYVIEIADSNGTWHVDEVKGIAIYSDGSKIIGRLPYQSEMTPTLVDEILTIGDCNLPTLNTSIITHKVFIESMLDHWQRHIDQTANFIPIT